MPIEVFANGFWALFVLRFEIGDGLPAGGVFSVRSRNPTGYFSGLDFIVRSKSAIAIETFVPLFPVSFSIFLCIF